MKKSRHFIISLLFVTYCGACPVFAQSPSKPSPSKPSPSKPSPSKSSPSKSSADKKDVSIGATLKKWDANGDGMLQTSEIPQEARSKVEAWAKDRKLDPAKPLEIGRLLKDDTTEANGTSKNEKNAKKEGEKNAEQKADRKADKAGKLKRAQLDKEVAVGSREGNKLAFGQRGAVSAEKKRPAGFGQNDESVSDSKDDNSNPVQPAPPSDDESDKKAAIRKQFGTLAKSMMYQHDANKNGKLERSEWSRLKGDPGAFDQDGDGSLSMSELTDKLAGFGSREKDVTARRKARREAYGKSTRSKSSYRFLTPHERLPSGLPDWFVEQDENEDGQLSLYEFSAEKLTESAVRRFQQLDLNRDGILVPPEYLKSTDVK